MSEAVAPSARTRWRTLPAGRVAFLVDAESYFAAVASACEQARDSIVICGWAIDSRIRLRRDEAAPRSGLPDELGPFLAALARRTASLKVRVLAWDFAMLFGLESGFLPVFRTQQERNRRVQWELDSEHAFGAGQHAKIVVIDGRVAFVSGMDLTAGRWDTRAHAPDDPRRTDGGKAHGPYHDVATVFDGDAAAELARLLELRWKRATGRGARFANARARVPALAPGTRIGDAIDRAGAMTRRTAERARAGLRRLRPPPPAAPGDPWPANVEPDLRDADVAIARTEAAYLWHPEVREIEALWLDGIARARSCIFIENQYFTSKTIADALAARLGEPAGPEVVIVQPLSCAGWLEQATMGVLRDIQLRALRDADTHGRLRVYYPVASDGEAVYVHSKVLVIDDVSARIGSANASNRSMTLDTECDVEFHAGEPPEARAAIARFRDGLLAEHLGTKAERVQEAMTARGSLGAAIESLRGDGRSLRPLALDSPAWLATVLPTSLADPERTAGAEAISAELMPAGQPHLTRGQKARSIALIALLLALTVTWAALPVGVGEGARTLAEIVRPWASNPLAPFLAIAAFVVLGIVAFPMSVLVLASELAFGPVVGTIVSLTGGMASSLFAYAQGRVVGRRWLRRLGGSSVNRVSRALGRHGVTAIATARLLPFVPWTLTSLLAGASHLRPLDYVLGTAIGLVPIVLGAALVTDAAVAPGMRGVVELGVFLALLLGVGAWARARLHVSSGGD